MRAALLSLALALAALAASAQGIEALEAQLDKAREAAPMAIKPFLVVSRPAKHFGDFEERPAKEFRRGEKMHFYAEPRNLSQPKTAAGTYEPALEVDIEVQGQKGESME